MPRTPSLPDTGSRFWQMWNLFWPELSRQRRLIAGSFIALVISVGMQLLEPWPFKFILDHLLRKSTRGASAAVSGILGLGFSAETLLIVAAVAYVLIIWLRATVEYLQTIGFARIGNRVVSHVRSKLYR